MKEIFRKSPTFRLFKREPSFSDGIATLIDMSPNLTRYNQDDTENEADINSLRADWYAIGHDMLKTIEDYEQQREQTTVQR